MPTRFRLTSSGTAPSASPAYQSYSHNASNRRQLLTVDTSALTTTGYAPDAADHLVAGDAMQYQFTSNPMSAGITFSNGGTIQVAIQALEANAGNNLQLQFFASIVSEDGSTVRRILRSKVLEGSEMGTTIAAEHISTTQDGASYTTVAGDRLVVELGASGTPTASGGTQGHNFSLRTGGGGAGGDEPAADGGTGTTTNPWVEFAPTITFLVSATLTESVTQSDAWVGGIPGAFAAVNKVAHRDNTDLTVYSTSQTLTPTANRLYLAAVAGRQAGGVGGNTPTLTGAGLTWDQIDLEERVGNGRKVTLFRAMGTGTLGTLEADFLGQTQQACEIIVDEIDGVDTSGTNGSGAIVQTEGSQGGSSAAPSVTLLSAIGTGNGTWGVQVGNADADVVAGTGYTELGEARGTTPTGAMGTEFRSDGSTTIDWATQATNWVALGVEVKAGAGGSTVTGSWSDAVTQSDAFVRIGTFVRTTTENVTQADALGRIGTFLRSVTNAVSQSDAWAGSKLLARTWSESVTQSDALARVGTFVRALSNSVTQADAWTRAASMVRSMTNSVTQADAWTRAASFTRSLANSVTQSDVWTGLKIIAKTWSESVTQADAWTRTGTFTRTLTNSVTQADAWSRVGTFARSFTSTVGQADTWVGTKIGAIIASWSETVTQSDAWTRTGTYLRSFTSTVTQADAWTRLRTLTRSFTSTVTQADAWARVAALTRSFTSTVTQSDAWTRAQTLTRTLVDSVTHATEFSGGLFAAVVGAAGSRIVEAGSRVGSTILGVVRNRSSGSAGPSSGSDITEVK